MSVDQEFRNDLVGGLSSDFSQVCSQKCAGFHLFEGLIRIGEIATHSHVWQVALAVGGRSQLFSKSDHSQGCLSIFMA